MSQNIQLEASCTLPFLFGVSRVLSCAQCWDLVKDPPAGSYASGQTQPPRMTEACGIGVRHRSEECGIFDATHDTVAVLGICDQNRGNS